jgi:hypothetical protein
LGFKIKILFFFKFYLAKTKVIVYLPTLLGEEFSKKATTEEPLF